MNDETAEVYTGPIPKGAVRCQRCGRPCRTGSPDPKARMLRKSTGGFCLDCAVTDWLRNTYPVNLLVGAAPLLGTDRARRDQEQWDDVDDCDVHSISDTLAQHKRLEGALGAMLGGDSGPIDAMTAEREEREAARARRKQERVAENRRPERKLLMPAIREAFGDIMQAAFAQARLEDVDWEWIVEHWPLPFPSGRHHKRSRGACAP